MTPERRSSMPGSKLLSNLTGRHQIDVQCFLPFLVRERPEPPPGALDPPTQFTRISMPLQLLRSLSSTSCTPRAVAMSVLINSAGCWLREDVNAQWWRQKCRPLSTCGPWPLPSLWSRRSQDPLALEFVPVNGKRAGCCHYPISSEVILPFASANV